MNRIGHEGKTMRTYYTTEPAPSDPDPISPRVGIIELTLLLTEPQVEALAALAQRRGLSPAQLLRRVIGSFLAADADGETRVAPAHVVTRGPAVGRMTDAI
jgi:hypothetical protein